MAGLGWYGPLINLSSTCSHVDDFVQLLVFVHRSNPLQYKLARGGTVIRTDIHVGDETQPFFAVSLWNKHLASSVSAGHIILLQNVKVVKFGSIIEARTVQYSSVISLVHPYDSILSKGVDELMGGCRVSGTAKDKLRRVIEWVQRTRSSLCNELERSIRTPALRNWKLDEDQTAHKFELLSEALNLESPCTVIFHASVGEIFVPSVSDDERMFISRRLMSRTDCVVEDMICTGCQLCGSSLGSDSTSAQTADLYHCKQSSNLTHSVGYIYRPFMLYVWDESGYIPLLVRNKAAEILFGNMKAERVYNSYKAQFHTNLSKGGAEGNCREKSVKEGIMSSTSVRAARSGTTAEQNGRKITKFHVIWLVLLKLLLLQRKNGPLQFETLVTPSLELEDGRFEMIGMTMPCINSHVISETQSMGSS